MQNTIPIQPVKDAATVKKHKSTYRKRHSNDSASLLLQDRPKNERCNVHTKTNRRKADQSSSPSQTCLTLKHFTHA